MKIKPLMLAAGLLIAFSGMVHADLAKSRKLIAEGVAAEKEGKWKTKIKWAKTAKEVLARAKKSKKPILVFIAVPMNKAKKGSRC